MEELSGNWVGDYGECLDGLFLDRGFYGSQSNLGFNGEGGHNYQCCDHVVDGNGSNGSCLGVVGEDLEVVLVPRVSAALASLTSPAL